MIHKKRLFSILICGLLVTVVGALARLDASAEKKLVNAHVEAVQQPLYSDYRGVRINMTTDEVRAKLGKPTMAADDQDYYIVSETETVQIAYDTAHKTKAISVDFLEGIGAPDYRAVVGPNLQINADGSMYKLVFYESHGFWVSYNRSVGGVPTVTITIQRIKN